MDNSLLTILFALPMLLLFYLDAGNNGKYFTLGLFTLLFALPFEVFSVTSGFWSYSATPQVFSVSVFTLLAYFPWMVYNYFTGNLISRHLKLDGISRYLLYGLSGSLYAGLFFDQVSVYLGYYTFHLRLMVFGVPLAVIVAEALCVMVVVFLFERLRGLHFPKRGKVVAE